ncbi:MAG: hypothetical protein KDJ66_07115, partial [Nitratireductor sp.]|nr:hypothetical protein [Nitratireductor sp.]
PPSKEGGLSFWGGMQANTPALRLPIHELRVRVNSLLTMSEHNQLNNSDSYGVRHASRQE